MAEESKERGDIRPAVRAALDSVIAPVPWRFHAGMQALVFCDPTLRGKVLAFPTADIRAAGWICDDLELRRCLPRAEERRIQVSNEAQLKVLTAARRMR